MCVCRANLRHIFMMSMKREMRVMRIETNAIIFIRGTRIQFVLVGLICEAIKCFFYF